MVEYTPSDQNMNSTVLSKKEKNAHELSSVKQGKKLELAFHLMSCAELQSTSSTVSCPLTCEQDAHITLLLWPFMKCGQQHSVSLTTLYKHSLRVSS